MPRICLERLPRRATVADLLGLLDRVGQIDRRLVGKIELRGGRAMIEVPSGWEARLVKALDGAVLDDRHLRASLDLPAAPQTVSPHGGPEEHFHRLARLLDQEAAAEAERAMQDGRRLSPADAERTGNSLLDLVVVDEETGLGGRDLVRLRKRSRLALPWNRFDVGKPVVLSADSERSDEGFRGVVCERNEFAVTVALNGLPETLADNDSLRLDVSHDEVALGRQKNALERVRLARGDRLAQLRDVLLGQRPASFAPEADEPPLDDGLNASQQAAVRFALSAHDVALVHGPPGTGKTRAVVEVIRRAVARGQKVLACAPSNLAVDNIFERLLATSQRVVRLGHPARVLPEFRSHTLDLLVDEHPDVRLAHKLVKEALATFRRADRFTRAKPLPGAKREMREEARSLLTDARRLELQAVEQILNGADVLCATTTGLNSEVLGARRFDLAVIDEACQSTEPGCWIPLLRADRVVLAGDDCQLPPTVVSEGAARAGFGVSLFERLNTLSGEHLTRMLAVQYRMHAAIMDFSAAEFYAGQLLADPSVAGHLLCDLPDVPAEPLTTTPLEFVDTAGAGLDEEPEPDGESRLNRGEARVVGHKVRALLDAGIAPEQIAVISPYAAQVRLLREEIRTAGLEIDSVDGFQGREKEAVVISLVRCNLRGEIGFLGDVRRMNVAMTRARRKLVMVGDSATLCGHPFYKRLLEYLEQRQAYHTVWEEPDAL
jgi:superfamily I DNA and/or RNA helicase